MNIRLRQPNRRSDVGGLYIHKVATAHATRNAATLPAATLRMRVRDVPEVVTSSIVPSSNPVLA